MKVGDLKKKLEEFDDDLDIKLQIDPEGNGYEDVYGIDLALFRDETAYSINWTASECCLGEREWEEFKKNGKRVALIYP